MTGRPEDIAQAQAAQQQGEAAHAAHVATIENMDASIGGSEEFFEDATATSLDAQSVPGIGTPWTPDGVSPQPTYAPNVLDPLDNSQSQG